MDMLRDPIWQFIGVVASIILGVASLAVAIKALPSPPKQSQSTSVYPVARNTNPSTRRNNSRFLWIGINCISPPIILVVLQQTWLALVWSLSGEFIGAVIIGLVAAYLGE